MSLSYDAAIEQIKNQTDILEIISEEVILKKKGSSYWGLCPFHGEKTPFVKKTYTHITIS